MNESKNCGHFQSFPNNFHLYKDIYYCFRIIFYFNFSISIFFFYFSFVLCEITTSRDNHSFNFIYFTHRKRLKRSCASANLILFHKSLLFRHEMFCQFFARQRLVYRHICAIHLSLLHYLHIFIAMLFFTTGQEHFIVLSFRNAAVFT